LGFAHLDSGALYRAVTLAAVEAGAVGAARALDAAREARVRLVLVGKEFRPEARGVDVSQAIRGERVTAQVSAIAALSPVRDWVNERLREAARADVPGVLVDGRDIGTVVFPDAPLKIFLTASPETRAQRRLSQEGRAADAESLKRTSQQLTRRDEADASRSVAPLKSAPDAIALDTTHLSFADQVARIVALARKVFS
jgi:cytidylate kinase